MSTEMYAVLFVGTVVSVIIDHRNHGRVWLAIYSFMAGCTGTILLSRLVTHA